MDKKDVLNKKELFLNSLLDLSHKQFYEDIKAGSLKVDDLEKFLAFIGSSFQDIYEKKEALDLKIEEIDKKIKTFEKELAFYFEYKIPQEIDIESKDKETILPIFSKKLKGKFFYLT